METAASTRKGWPVKVSGGEGERRERGGGEEGREGVREKEGRIRGRGSRGGDGG